MCDKILNLPLTYIVVVNKKDLHVVFEKLALNTQPAFTSSKLVIETLEQLAKSLQTP